MDRNASKNEEIDDDAGPSSSTETMSSRTRSGQRKANAAKNIDTGQKSVSEDMEREHYADSILQRIAMHSYVPVDGSLEDINQDDDYEDIEDITTTKSPLDNFVESMGGSKQELWNIARRNNKRKLNDAIPTRAKNHLDSLRNKKIERENNQKMYNSHINSQPTTSSTNEKVQFVCDKPISTIGDLIKIMEDNNAVGAITDVRIDATNKQVTMQKRATPSMEELGYQTRQYFPRGKTIKPISAPMQAQLNRLYGVNTQESGSSSGINSLHSTQNNSNFDYGPNGRAQNKRKLPPEVEEPWYSSLGQPFAAPVEQMNQFGGGECSYTDDVEKGRMGHVPRHRTSNRLVENAWYDKKNTDEDDGNDVEDVEWDVSTKPKRKRGPIPGVQRGPYKKRPYKTKLKTFYGDFSDELATTTGREIVVSTRTRVVDEAPRRRKAKPVEKWLDMEGVYNTTTPEIGLDVPEEFKHLLTDDVKQLIVEAPAHKVQMEEYEQFKNVVSLDDQFGSVGGGLQQYQMPDLSHLESKLDNNYQSSSNSNVRRSHFAHLDVDEVEEINFF